MFPLRARWFFDRAITVSIIQVAEINRQQKFLLLQREADLGKAES
jgi:hypothetical protein